jgi:hypothetical protein
VRDFCHWPADLRNGDNARFCVKSLWRNMGFDNPLQATAIQPQSNRVNGAGRTGAKTKSDSSRVKKREEKKETQSKLMGRV